MYPEVEPYERGQLELGDGNLLYWETCGNPLGKPAVVLHGGPGSGCDAWDRRLLDPQAYRIVLFDQRNCGRSTPQASEADVDLTSNHAAPRRGPRAASPPSGPRAMAGDRRVMGERARARLRRAAPRPGHRDGPVGRQLGATVGVRLLFRGGVGVLFPEQWERLRNAVPEDRRELDVVEAYAELLFDPDPDVRARAAYEWCLWESATPSWPPSSDLAERFEDPTFALAFARIVTHYVRHDAWLGDDVLLREIGALAEIRAILVQGRFDFQAPLGSAWAVHRAWPGSELVVVDDAGHDASASGITEQIVRATDRFAKK